MTQLQFKTKPFAHQLEDLEHTKDKPFYGMHWEMGLGKTKYALDLAAYLWNCQRVGQMLFITKNGVDKQFIEEAIPTHLPLLEKQFITDNWNGDSHCWRVLKKYGSTLNDRLFIAAINCEALGTPKGRAAVMALVKNRPTYLAVDESQEFAGLTATRTKNLLQIAPLCPWRRTFTGTPTGGNPLHLYPQMAILSTQMIPESIWSFEYKYCVKQDSKIWYKDKLTGVAKERTIKQTVGFKNLDNLESRISPYVSRRLKADCIDLPPKIYKTLAFDLNEQERALYQRVKNQTLVEIAAGKYVDTEMGATKLLRLHQVSCGFAVFEDLITGEGGQALLPNPSRLKCLLSYLKMCQGKAIIWSRFSLSIDMIMKAVAEEFGAGSVVQYDGRITDNVKHANKTRFLQERECRFFVGQQRAGGVGLDLPVAQDVFYYSNDHRLITRLQSEDRAHRIGSKGAVTYYDLCATNTVDGRIIKALKERFDIAAQLAGDQLRSWIE